MQSGPDESRGPTFATGISTYLGTYIIMYLIQNMDRINLGRYLIYRI